MPPKGPSPTLPPEILEPDMNVSSDSQKGMTASNAVLIKPLFLVPPMKPTQPINFELLIDEINEDIHHFDKVDPTQAKATDTHSNRSPTQVNGSSSVKASPIKSQPAKPTDQSPPKDITNIP